MLTHKWEWMTERMNNQIGYTQIDRCTYSRIYTHICSHIYGDLFFYVIYMSLLQISSFLNCSIIIVFTFSKSPINCTQLHIKITHMFFESRKYLCRYGDDRKEHILSPKPKVFRGVMSTCQRSIQTPCELFVSVGKSRPEPELKLYQYSLPVMSSKLAFGCICL